MNFSEKLVATNPNIKEYLDKFFENQVEEKTEFFQLIDKLAVPELTPETPIVVWTEVLPRDIAAITGMEVSSKDCIDLTNHVNQEHQSYYDSYDRTNKEKCVYSFVTKENSKLTQKHHDLAISLWCKMVADNYEINYSEPFVIETVNGKKLILTGPDRLHFSQLFSKISSLE